MSASKKRGGAKTGRGAELSSLRRCFVGGGLGRPVDGTLALFFGVSGRVAISMWRKVRMWGREYQQGCDPHLTWGRGRDLEA